MILFWHQKKKWNGLRPSEQSKEKSFNETKITRHRINFSHFMRVNHFYVGIIGINSLSGHYDVIKRNNNGWNENVIWMKICDAKSHLNCDVFLSFFFYVILIYSSLSFTQTERSIRVRAWKDVQNEKLNYRFALIDNVKWTRSKIFSKSSIEWWIKSHAFLSGNIKSKQFYSKHEFWNWNAEEWRIAHLQRPNTFGRI